MREFTLIERYFRPLVSKTPEALALMDDAAHIDVARFHGKKLIISCDTLVEGVHFLENSMPYTLAQKCLAVNLSDIAGKGACPYGFMLALQLPPHLDESWFEAFAQGLQEASETYSIHLLGGDTVSTSGPLAVSITVLGTASRSLTRKGARVGDLLCVSGMIGAGILGLETAQKKYTDDRALAHYLNPIPQLSLGMKLTQLDAVHASMDISDGLLADAEHMAKASHCKFEIYLNQIPLWDTKKDAMMQITGGDDYQLLFSTTQKGFDFLIKNGEDAYEIGLVKEGVGVCLLDKQGGQHITMQRKGYQHV